MEPDTSTYSPRRDYRSRIYATYASKFQGSNLSFDAAAAQRWGRPYDHYFRGWLPADRSARIADLACGNGYLLHFFRSRGYANVGGVDVSPEQVQLSRQVVPDVAEGSVLEYLTQRQGSFDLLTAVDIIEHLTKDEVLDFLDGCFAALRPGGRLIIQTPNADSPFAATIRYGDFTHEVAFNAHSLGSLLRLAGFKDVEGREQGPVAGLSGMSTIRWMIWKAIRGGIRLWHRAETGAPGSGVFTRVFVISAVRK